VEFDTYRGVSAIGRSVLDWHLCRTATLELLAQHHSSMPYVHMGFIATLYTRTLFSRDNGDFLPKSQYSCLNFRPFSTAYTDEGKAVPVEAWTNPEGSRKQSAHEGRKIISPKPRTSLLL
jgi:hypothetical protein